MLPATMLFVIARPPPSWMCTPPPIAKRPLGGTTADRFPETAQLREGERSDTGAPDPAAVGVARHRPAGLVPADGGPEESESTGVPDPAPVAAGEPARAAGAGRADRGGDGGCGAIGRDHAVRNYDGRSPATARRERIRIPPPNATVGSPVLIPSLIVIRAIETVGWPASPAPPIVRTGPPPLITSSARLRHEGRCSSRQRLPRRTSRERSRSDLRPPPRRRRPGSSRNSRGPLRRRALASEPRLRRSPARGEREGDEGVSKVFMCPLLSGRPTRYRSPAHTASQLARSPA